MCLTLLQYFISASGLSRTPQLSCFLVCQLKNINPAFFPFCSAKLFSQVGEACDAKLEGFLKVKMLLSNAHFTKNHCMLISYWTVSIPFLGDAKLPTFLLGIKIKILYASLRDYCGNIARLASAVPVTLHSMVTMLMLILLSIVINVSVSQVSSLRNPTLARRYMVVSNWLFSQIYMAKFNQWLYSQWLLAMYNWLDSQ